MSDSIKKLTTLGQSIWYDNIQRKLLESGELKAMIERGDIRGVTSNPTIFNKAIAGSADYDSSLKTADDVDVMTLYERLAIEDIQHAADVLRPVYEATKRADGYVSLEVSPYLAMSTEATETLAHRATDLRASEPSLELTSGEHEADELWEIPTRSLKLRLPSEDDDRLTLVPEETKK